MLAQGVEVGVDLGPVDGLGGIALEDSRPDPERLKRIARVAHGESTTAADVKSLSEPAATIVTVERKSSPWLPSWVWALAAAVA